MLTPEGREKARVKTFLTEIGACHRWPVPYGYGQPDIDCHACIAGVMWAVEVKKPGARPTPIQWRTLAEWQAAGAKIAWGTADDIIPIIERWLAYQAHGGAIHETEQSPNATIQQGARQMSGGRGG